MSRICLQDIVEDIPFDNLDIQLNKDYKHAALLGDGQVLLALHNAEPTKLSVLDESLAASDDSYKTNGRR